MWNKQTFSSIILIVLLIQFVSAGVQRRNADYEGAPDDDGFQTYTRRGVTLRIKPRSMTIRIGGKNVSPEQLLEQAKQAKQLELLAVRQLLNTKHPVKRTSFENGHKHTSTYTLEPDGSILYTQVEDIDEQELDRRFEEIFRQQRERQAKEHPNKLGDWEWAEDGNNEKRPNVFQAPLQPFPANTPYQPTTPQLVPKAPKDLPPSQIQPDSQPSGEDDLFNPSKPPEDLPPTFYKPNQFQPDWSSDNYDDPFNPPELPNFKFHDYDDGGDLDSFNKPFSSPVGKTNTITNTETDNEGNTVRTTITTGPNEWRRKTVKVSTNVQPHPAAEITTTIKPETKPSLDDFLKSQYGPSKDTNPLPVLTNQPTPSTTPKIIKTINIDDLPPLAVFNANKPADEQFLKPLGPNGADQKPIRTLKIDNIPPSSDLNPDRTTQTQIRTYQSTYRGSQPPSADNLNPDMLAVLKRAGIKPEDISNGQTITKTRVEPDGRIVKTTYRVTTNYDDAEPPRYNIPNNWPGLYNRPSIFGSPSLPRQHQSVSHSGVDFSSLGETTTTIRPTVRDREPLEPQDEDEDEVAAVTLNPLLIHPVHAVVPSKDSYTPSAGAVKSAIAEFLAKLGLTKADLKAQNGQFTKTIVDDDGSVLTARLFLTPAINIKQKK